MSTLPGLISATKDITPKASSGQKGVIFDLDGTLVDTAGDLAATMNHVLVNYGYPQIPADEVRFLVGHGAKAMLRQGITLSTGEVPSDNVLDPMLDGFFSHYQENIAVLSKPFEGVRLLLDALLERDIPCGVCTNKREAPARLLIEELGLTDYFVAIVGGDSAGAAKPDPAPLYMCLEAMRRTVNSGSAGGEWSDHVQPMLADIVFFGDSDTDISAAKNAGLSCFIAEFGYGPLKLIDQADMVFQSYEQALQILKARFRM